MLSERAPWLCVTLRAYIGNGLVVDRCPRRHAVGDGAPCASWQDKRPFSRTLRAAGAATNTLPVETVNVVRAVTPVSRRLRRLSPAVIFGRAPPASEICTCTHCGVRATRGRASTHGIHGSGSVPNRTVPSHDACATERRARARPVLHVRHSCRVMAAVEFWLAAFMRWHAVRVLWANPVLCLFLEFLSRALVMETCPCGPVTARRAAIFADTDSRAAWDAFIG